MSITFKEYKSVRDYTREICAPLQTEDYVPQPVPFVSPPKWHLAHTTWFFEEFVLKPDGENYSEFHEDYSYLFNSYYNTVGKRTLRADRGNLTRPGVEGVYEYREYVDKAVQKLMASGNLTPRTMQVLELGMHHEQQHQELLLTDLKFILGHNPIFPIYQNGYSLVEQTNDTNDVGFVAIEEGVYEIGFDVNGENGFHYDNELGRHKVYLHDTEISKSLVTAGEYLEFINDGGYAKHEYWLDEGWGWVNQTGATAPLYWHNVDGEWWYFTLNGFKPVDPATILCHINYYEAWAYAAWREMRLPTEFEWEAASEQLNWGRRWEWTESAYLPYPGFAKAEGAIGEYNGKFMVNTMVLRGGSTATSPNHSRPTYRNFFHPPLQWQCTGIRLAKQR